MPALVANMKKPTSLPVVGFFVAYVEVCFGARALHTHPIIQGNDLDPSRSPKYFCGCLEDNSIPGVSGYCKCLPLACYSEGQGASSLTALVATAGESTTPQLPITSSVFSIPVVSP